MMKKTISQCMIVKNEEKNIRRALSWGKDIMCEQIVVDTGSSDRTVEIAREMGAKIFFFPWINDFAAAKNFAIDQAKGDWIAFLDADESFTPEDTKKIPEILEYVGDDVDGLLTGIVDLDENNHITSGGTMIRFFVNRPDLRYVGKIHEHLVRKGRSGLHLTDATKQLAFLHTGYQEQEKKDKSKFERNLNIILEILKQEPENCDYLGYLGDTYSSDGKNEEARDAYKKAVAAMPEKLEVYDQRSSYTYTNLLRVSQCLNAPEAEVEAIYKEAVEKLPKEPDFDCVMGDWYWRKGQYEKAVQMYELAIAKLETYGTVNRGIITTSMLIQMYECLGEGCRRLGDYQKAVRYCVIVLNTDHKDMNALLTLINCFTEKNISAEEVVQFLGKIYDYSDIKDKVILLQVAMAMGRKDLERMFRGILLPQEREEFDAAMETAQSGAPVIDFFQLSHKKRKFPFTGAVSKAVRICDRNITVRKEFCDQDKVTVLRQASLTHKGDQDMTGRKKGSCILGRMVCYRFHLKAICSKDRWDQTVIGAALGGIIAIGRRPVCDRYRGNGFRHL